MTIKIFVTTFLLFVTATTTAKSHSYSGAMNIFSSGKDILALHEHGSMYDYDTKKVLSFSNLEILNLKQNTSTLIAHVPRLVALKWIVDSNLLIGVSTLVTSGSPHIYVFDEFGHLYKEHAIDCDSEERAFFYCEEVSEFEGVVTKLNSFNVSKIKDSVKVCIGSYCQSIDISK